MFIYFYIFIRIIQHSAALSIIIMNLWTVKLATDISYTFFIRSVLLFFSFDFEFLMQLRAMNFRSTKSIIREKRCYEYELSNFHLIFFSSLHFVACTAHFLSHRKSWPAFVFILTCKWDLFCVFHNGQSFRLLDSVIHDWQSVYPAHECSIFKNERHLTNNRQQIALYMAEFMNKLVWNVK